MLGYARVVPRRVLALALVLAACGPDGGGGSGLSGGPLGTSSSTTSAPATTADADASASATGTSGGRPGSSSGGVDGSTTATSDTAPLLDLGDEPDPHPGTPAWCSAKKVDLLFVIPRDELMSAVQSTLIGSLPGIFDWIEDLFADFDFQIMVVDADDTWGASKCSTAAACPGDFGCAAIGEPLYPCWAPKAGEVTYCDHALGGGVVFPAAKGASNKRCPVPPGRRYLRRGDPGLAEAFECVGHVGYGAGGSAVGKLMMDIDAPELDGAFGCNAGFLRDDALLFVTLISAIGGDGSSPYNPLVWAQSLQATKGLDPEAIFMLGFLPDAEPGLCPSAEGGGQFEEFIGYFENSLVRSVCSPSYAPGFAEAVKKALALCEPVLPE